MTLCPPCTVEADRWLDYKLPAVNWQLLSAGIPQVGKVSEFHRLRFEEWKRTIATQLGLIESNCTTNHQGGVLR